MSNSSCNTEKRSRRESPKASIVDFNLEEFWSTMNFEIEGGDEAKRVIWMKLVGRMKSPEVREMVPTILLLGPQGIGKELLIEITAEFTAKTVNIIDAYSFQPEKDRRER
jgi:hypothetical protein